MVAWVYNCTGMIVKLTFLNSPYVTVTQSAPIYVKIVQGGVSGGGGASDWDDITNKPSTFTPSAHTHPISDVTGLQTALDGKQASGSYANATHSHVIADVTGLQTALDGKQASGSYATTSQVNAKQDTLVSGTNIKTVNGNSLLGSGDLVISGGGSGTWGSIGGTLSNQTDLQSALDGKQASGSYAAASHTHTIANVTGLQTALDGKAATSHTHVIADVTGLQTALDGKQASGSYAAASHTHVIADTTGLQTALDGKQANITGTDGQVILKSGSTAGVVTAGTLAYPDMPLFIQQTQPTPTTYQYIWYETDVTGSVVTIWNFKP